MTRKRNQNVVFNGSPHGKLRRKPHAKVAKSKPLPKEVCKDGPFAGQILLLHDSPNTAVIHLQGQTGYYNRGFWISV